MEGKLDKEQVCYRKLKRYKYQLMDAYRIQIDLNPTQDILTDYVQLSIDGQLTLTKYYAWDGPSGPTFDTLNFMRGSLVHDGLYQLIREKHLDYDLQEFADQLLKQMCIEDGMSRFRAWYVHKAVSIFGKRSLKKSRKKEEKPIFAP